MHLTKSPKCPRIVIKLLISDVFNLQKVIFFILIHWFGKNYYNYPPQGRWTAQDIYLDASCLGVYSHHYSPPSEWIMCDLGVFPIFLENDLLKVDRILGLTFS